MHEVQADLDVERVSVLQAGLRLLRPQHWIKNLFVLAPVLFSGKAFGPAALSAALTFVAFSIAASYAYVANDIFDLTADRAHPVKRNRPLARGQLSRTQAIVLAVGLAAGALGVAATVNQHVVIWIGAYIALNLAYSAWLKHMVLLDLFAIAGFFLIRLVAGAAAVQVRPSVWLVMCGGLLALYLAVSKRQHELATTETPSDHRRVLREYSPTLLDQLAVVLIAASFLSYCQYALLSDTAKHVGSDLLAWGSPFVLYGLLRYQFLVHQRGKGNPLDTIFTDRPLLANVTIWVAYNAWALYR